MSIKLGITGGIGAGKSVVSRLLEVLDIPVYLSDNEARRLTKSHPEIRTELCKLIGDHVYQNGQLNKPLRASYLFANEAKELRVTPIIIPVFHYDFFT